MIFIGVPIYEINHEFFIYDSEEYWYYAGFIASDGYISDEKVELCLNKKDAEILKRFRDIICPGKPIYDKPSTRSKKFTVHSKNVAGHFKNLFCMTTNNKAKEIKFPNVPEKYLRHFVRGLMDGGGCIDQIKGYRDFGDYKKIYVGTRLRILGNYDFLQEMIIKISEQVPNKTRKVSKKGAENVWYITYNFRIAERILEWMYNDSKIYLKRKYKKYKEVIEGKHEEIVYSRESASLSLN